MKTFLSFVFSALMLICLCQGSNAQSVDVQSQQNLTELGLLSNSSLSDPIGLTNPDKDFDVKGSPYLNEEFETGWIALGKINDTVSNVEIRYNIFKDALELSNNSQIKELNPNPIKAFSSSQLIGQSLFVNSDYIDGLAASGYVQQVFSGQSLSIYLKHLVTRKIRDSSEPYGSAKNYIEYKEQTKTYFLVGNKSYLISNKKDLEVIYRQRDEIKKIKKSELGDPNFLYNLGFILDEN